VTCIGFGLDGFGFGFGGWGLIFNRAAGLLEFVLEGLKERGEMPGPPRPSAHGLLAGRRRSVSMSLLPGPAWHRACHAASTHLCAGRIASSSIHLVQYTRSCLLAYRRQPTLYNSRGENVFFSTH